MSDDGDRDSYPPSWEEEGAAEFGYYKPEDFTAALRRARDIETLDGWVAKDESNQVVTERINRLAHITLWPDGRLFSAATPDAARHAAAEAIRKGEV